MPRHGENIHKRKDGRWEARFIDYYTNKGKAHYKSLYSNSYTKVKEKLKNISSDNSHNELQAKYMTIDTLCNMWLDNVRLKLKASTYALYQNVIKAHIIPYFGLMDIRRIESDTVNEFVKFKSADGRLDGKGGLSAKTVRDIYQILERILEYGSDHKYITTKINRPTLPRSEYKELQVFNIFEVSRLTNYIYSNTDIEKLGILLVLYTGIRLGELCALKWTDVDIENGLIRITKTLQRIKNTDITSESKTIIIIDTPKSIKSLREIPVPETLKSLIMHYINVYPKDSYLLTGSNKYFEPRTFQMKFKRYLSEAGISPRNFHTLRHTFATCATEAGFEIKSLSEILGHSTVKFTLDRYVHSTDRLKREGMEKLANFY